MAFDFSNINNDIKCESNKIVNYVLCCKFNKKVQHAIKGIGFNNLNVNLNIFAVDNDINLLFNPLTRWIDTKSITHTTIIELIALLSCVGQAKQHLFKILKSKTYNKIYSLYFGKSAIYFDLLQENLMYKINCGNLIISNYLGYYDNVCKFYIDRLSLIYVMKFLYYAFDTDVKKILYLDNNDYNPYIYIKSMHDEYVKWLREILTKSEYKKISKEIKITYSLLFWIISSLHYWKSTDEQNEYKIYIFDDEFVMKYSLYDWANCLFDIKNNCVFKRDIFFKRVQYMQSNNIIQNKAI